jgi:hypothetical protein
MFDNPESDLRLGDAWDLSTAPDTGCYAYQTRSADPGPAWDKYSISWRDKSNLNARLRIGGAFGFGASLQSASSGLIEVNGLVTAMTTNVAPRAVCIDQRGGLPRKPVIVALIGADSLVFDLRDSSGATLTDSLRYRSLTASLDASRSRTNGTLATFGTRRWVGARFEGFELDTTIRDSVATDFHALGSTIPLAWHFEAVVRRIQGRYMVVLNRTIPPPHSDTVIISERSTFFFGIPANRLVSGDFYSGFVEGNAHLTEARIVARRQSYHRIPFDRGELRDSLRAWSGR